MLKLKLLNKQSQIDGVAMRVFFILMIVPLSLIAQVGKHGSKTISSQTIVNEYTYLTQDAISTNILHVTNSFLNQNNRFQTNLSPGDLIMVIQMQGAIINGTPQDSSWGSVLSYQGSGLHEFAEVLEVPDNTTIIIKCRLKYNYSYLAKTQVIRVPRYTTLTISDNATLTCPEWNGQMYGVVVVEANNNFQVNASGVISANEKGFRGGRKVNNGGSFNIQDYYSTNTNIAGEKGEGIAGFTTDLNVYGGYFCRGAAANGGGGGDAHNAGGGGGGNGGDITYYSGFGVPDISTQFYINVWNTERAGLANELSPGGGRGGATWARNNIDPSVYPPGNSLYSGDNKHVTGGLGGRPLDYSTGRIFLGGGGGSGDGNNSAGTAGGRGGGLIYLLCNGTLTGNGYIVANGATALATNGGGNDGAGGGGAGGTIVLNCNTSISSQLIIAAKGGDGGNYVAIPGALQDACGPGGGGGGGVLVTTFAVPNILIGGLSGTSNSSSSPTFPCYHSTKGNLGKVYPLVYTPLVFNAAFADAGPNQEYCLSGDSIVLKVTTTGTAVRTVKWSPRNYVGCENCIETKVHPSGNTMFYVTVTDSSGCSAVDSVYVKVKFNSSPIILSKNATICAQNDSAVISFSGNLDNPRWSPSIGLKCDSCNSTVAKPTTTTWYKLTGNDPNGCPYKDSVLVSVLPKAVINAEPDTVLCTSTGVILTATGNFQTVEWFPPTGISCTTCPQTVATPPKKDMVYYAIGRVGNGNKCDAMDSVRIRYAPGVEGLLPKTLSICDGQSTTLTVPFGGKVKWTPTSAVNCDTCKTVTVNVKANTIITVEGDSAGCKSKVQIDVKIINSTINFSLRKDTAICRGESVELKTTGISGASEVSWSPIDGLNCSTCVSPVASPNKTTKYYVKVGSGSCSKVDSVTVSVKYANIASVQPAQITLCKKDTTQVHIQRQNPNSTITWTPAKGLSCSTCPDPILTADSSKTYSIIIHDDGGCDTTLQLTVTVNSPPVFSVQNKFLTVCKGEFTQVNVVGDTTGEITWIPSIGVGCTTCASTTLQPSLSTTYYIRQRNASTNCESLDSVHVTVKPLPVVDSVTPNLKICVNGAVQLYASKGTSYKWTPSQGLDRDDIQSPTAKPNLTTLYNVSIFNIEACYKDTTVLVEVIQCGDEITITSNPTFDTIVACDTSLVTLNITNKGQIPNTIDSITIEQLLNCTIDKVFLKSSQSTNLPYTVNPNETYTGLSVKVLPNSNGPYSALIRIHNSHVDRVDTIRIDGNAVNRMVKAEIPGNTIEIDTSFILPVSVTSMYWNELQINQVRAVITTEMGSMTLDSSVKIVLGPVTDTSWSVTYNSQESTPNTFVFYLSGSTPLHSNGMLFQPSFISLLNNTFSFKPTISLSYPGLRIDCVDEESSSDSINVFTCAAFIRRVRIGAVTGFLTLKPNPVSDGTEVMCNYQLGHHERVIIKVVDVVGRTIQILKDEYQREGIHTVTINAESTESGLYYIVLHAGGDVYMQPLVISK